MNKRIKHIEKIPVLGGTIEVEVTATKHEQHGIMFDELAMAQIERAKFHHNYLYAEKERAWLYGYAIGTAKPDIIKWIDGELKLLHE